MTNEKPEILRAMDSISEFEIFSAFRRELIQIQKDETDPEISQLLRAVMNQQAGVRSLIQSPAGRRLLDRARNRALDDPLPLPTPVQEVLEHDAD